MNRSLMVPLDGESFGEYALPLALGIARRGGGSVQLVYVSASHTDRRCRASMWAAWRDEVDLWGCDPWLETTPG